MSDSMHDLGMQIARQQAALVWADPKCAGISRDPELTEAFAHVVYTWIVGAKGALLQTEYYRGILQQMNDALGCPEESRFASLPMAVARLVDVNQGLARRIAELEAVESNRLRQAAKDKRDLDYLGVQP